MPESLAGAAETAGRAGEAPPGPSAGTPAPAEPRRHSPVAASGCSPRDLGSAGTGLKRVTTDLRGGGGRDLPKSCDPHFEDRRRTGSAGEPWARAFRLQKLPAAEKPFVLSGDDKANQKEAPPGLFWTRSGRGCCIALRTGRLRRRTAIELPAVTTLSRLFSAEI